MTRTEVAYDARDDMALEILAIIISRFLKSDILNFISPNDFRVYGQCTHRKQHLIGSSVAHICVTLEPIRCCFFFICKEENCKTTRKSH